MTTKSEYIDEALARVKSGIRNRGLYASDGLCHNAQIGTFGHECGKPATWIGTKASGFQSGFCDHCKTHGDERHGYVAWSPIATTELTDIGEQYVIPGCERDQSRGPQQTSLW